MGEADPRAQIVGDHELRAPAHELEGADVRRRPVRQGLRPRRLGEGVARGPEHGHEDLRLPLLAGLAVDHRHRLPGVVDEQLLAGAVLLAYHQVELPGPGPVLVAEPRLYCSPRGGPPCTPATAAPASRSCAATPGGPRSSPAAAAPCGSAAAVETAAAPGRCRRPTRGRANSAPPPWRGADTRPPSTATSPGCERWLRRSTPRRKYSRSTSRILRMDNLLFASVRPSCKAGRSHGRRGRPAPLSSDRG